MKTLFVVSEELLDKHDGEEYDSILEVEHQPTTETMPEWANRVRQRIRKLWHEGAKDDEDKRVSVTLDAASPFNTLLIDLQLLLKTEEGIAVELPYLATTMPESHDREAQDALKKLDDREVQ